MSTFREARWELMTSVGQVTPNPNLYKNNTRLNFEFKMHYKARYVKIFTE